MENSVRLYWFWNKFLVGGLADIEAFGASGDVKGFLLACRDLQIHQITMELA